MEEKATIYREYPDNRKSVKPFLIVGIIVGIIVIASLLGIYLLFKYLIWYFDTYIGPSWL